MNANKLFLLLIASFLTVGCQHMKPAKNGQLTENKGNSDNPQTQYEEFVKKGDSLPIKSIVDVSGNTLSLDNTNKKKLVILFATWCSDSNRALKALNQSHLLNDESIEIIAIAREESDDIVKKWRDKNDIKVPLASDPEREIYQQFAAAGIPRLITVSQDNKIIAMNLAEGENQLQLIQWE